jgi:ATP-dependent RNA helicase DeaD
MSESSSCQDFAQLHLIDPVLKALKSVGYETPSPIQSETIPHIMAGEDVLGQAQTGTGKTAAFALPLLSRIALTERRPQVLVLTPTRELAIQVAEAFKRYAGQMRGFEVLPIYGGQDYGIQLKQLKRGVHVIVGTPGRLMDHMRRRTLVLDSLVCLVLDEADEMLRMGFIDDVEWILKHTPPQCQKTLFSATLPGPIRQIAQRYLKSPVEITIQTRTTTVESTRQRFWMVSGLHKLDALTRILEAEPFDGMIVFVRTRTITLELSEKLQARGYRTAPLNGELSQKKREKTIEDLRKGKIDILVATDVAARGLDVHRISHVINYDIPNDIDAYIHRIGRTGRAGRDGEAIIFVSPREKRMLRAIEKATNQTIDLMKLPSNEAINDKRIAEFKEKITDTLAVNDLGIYYQLVEQYRQERNIPAIEIAAALAKMIQGDRPFLLAKDEVYLQPEVVDNSKPPKYKSRPIINSRPIIDEETGEELAIERFRLEVGHVDGVKPGNIVGAISNETGIDGKYVGRIDIYDDYSTVDLPEGMPAEIFRQLKKVWVSGKQLKISRLETGKGAPRGKKSKTRLRHVGNQKKRRLQGKEIDLSGQKK